MTVRTVISNSYKNWSNYPNDIIFFPVKAEILYFMNLHMGGPWGDLGKLNIHLKFWKKGILYATWIEEWIAAQALPVPPPIFIIVKYEVSAFTGKKIISFGLLDQFLQFFQIWQISAVHSYVNIWSKILRFRIIFKNFDKWCIIQKQSFDFVHW